MKVKLFYLSALFLIVAVGCSKIKYPSTPTVGAVAGTYTGKFVSVHTNTPKNDTLKANILLTLSPSFTFSVSGDTSVVHAGSYGRFELTSGTTIQFFDATFPTSGTPTKIHLSGQYSYTFDQIYLDMNGSDGAGTTTYSYTLVKN